MYDMYVPGASVAGVKKATLYHLTNGGTIILNM